ncbi:Uncharacterised protein [Mycobacteroides abscessus subsp. abscessus]|nr:Uncharacterised protein [Mycobacteroides abscessus subsp. abscessus]SHW13136.1 Uncharacterised protein [Mycobacteroides abscessus subsp. abscessus]SIF04051.1 Uncharacterised protein [Mycobacteroides abscessus subsp. abscessus]SIL37520.1 Uncharacterised protein [Mycobacteroides abscessus subsp. abscessus]SKR00190.1 Uncharacterised protein [Mycobacteroides abscessus subsp. abscessus]
MFAVVDVAVVDDSGSDSAVVLATVGFAVVVAGWIRPEGSIDPGFWESAVTTAMVLAT